MGLELATYSYLRFYLAQPLPFLLPHPGEVHVGGGQDNWDRVHGKWCPWHVIVLRQLARLLRRVLRRRGVHPIQVQEIAIVVGVVGSIFSWGVEDHRWVEWGVPWGGGRGKILVAVFDGGCKSNSIKVIFTQREDCIASRRLPERCSGQIDIDVGLLICCLFECCSGSGNLLGSHFPHFGAGHPALLLTWLARLVLIVRIGMKMLLLDVFSHQFEVRFDFSRLVLPLLAKDDSCLKISKRCALL